MKQYDLETKCIQSGYSPKNGEPFYFARIKHKNSVYNHYREKRKRTGFHPITYNIVRSLFGFQKRYDYERKAR